MLYKLSVLALNTSFMKRAMRVFGRISSRKRVDNAELIKKYAPEKSFVDVGCMWGIDGLNSFLAEESGATKVIAVDVYPESEKFLGERRKRNSAVQFVLGDINLPETTEKIGVSDVVLCSGVLYHTPDPHRWSGSGHMQGNSILTTQSILRRDQKRGGVLSVSSEGSERSGIEA
jgi:2-polyprenyl-3-methyl-5-hydroxy-6-metoxy-1,4-benzoquinol methylase